MTDKSTPEWQPELSPRDVEYIERHVLERPNEVLFIYQGKHGFGPCLFRGATNDHYLLAISNRTAWALHAKEAAKHGIKYKEAGDPKMLASIYQMHDPLEDFQNKLDLYLKRDLILPDMHRLLYGMKDLAKGERWLAENAKMWAEHKLLRDMWQAERASRQRWWIAVAIGLLSALVVGMAVYLSKPENQHETIPAQIR